MNIKLKGELQVLTLNVNVPREFTEEQLKKHGLKISDHNVEAFNQSLTEGIENTINDAMTDDLGDHSILDSVFDWADFEDDENEEV